MWVSAGQSGLGKSTLVNTLFKSKVSRKSCTPNYEERIFKTVKLQTISHGWLKNTHTQNIQFNFVLEIKTNSCIYSAFRSSACHVFTDWMGFVGKICSNVALTVRSFTGPVINQINSSASATPTVGLITEKPDLTDHVWI